MPGVKKPYFAIVIVNVLKSWKIQKLWGGQVLGKENMEEATMFPTGLRHPGSGSYQADTQSMSWETIMFHWGWINPEMSVVWDSRKCKAIHVTPRMLIRRINFSLKIENWNLREHEWTPWLTLRLQSLKVFRLDLSHKWVRTEALSSFWWLVSTKKNSWLDSKKMKIYF